MSLPPIQEMDDTTFWDARRGKIYTSKGGLVIGEAVYCQGYNMMTDLVGKSSFFDVLCLNSLGYLPERRFCEWLDALFICMSYPDARIWCNQIGSLAGTLKCSPVAAVCSGILASDSRMYGPGVIKAGIQFITNAIQAINTGSTVKEIIENYPRKNPQSPPRIPGYVRPIALGDERIAPMEELATKLEFKIGKHLSLAYKIEETLIRDYNERMNLVGYCTAFLADQGLSTKESYRLLSTWVQSGVLACFSEANDNPPESFFPLQCEDIEYKGKPHRKVPD